MYQVIDARQSGIFPRGGDGLPVDVKTLQVALGILDDLLSRLLPDFFP